MRPAFSLVLIAAAITGCVSSKPKQASKTKNFNGYYSLWEMPTFKYVTEDHPNKEVDSHRFHQALNSAAHVATNTAIENGMLPELEADHNYVSNPPPYTLKRVEYRFVKSESRSLKRDENDYPYFKGELSQEVSDKVDIYSLDLVYRILGKEVRFPNALQGSIVTDRITTTKAEGRVVASAVNLLDPEVERSNLINWKVIAHSLLQSVLIYDLGPDQWEEKTYKIKLDNTSRWSSPHFLESEIQVTSSKYVNQWAKDLFPLYQKICATFKEQNKGTKNCELGWDAAFKQLQKRVDPKAYFTNMETARSLFQKIDSCENRNGALYFYANIAKSTLHRLKDDNLPYPHRFLGRYMRFYRRKQTKDGMEFIRISGLNLPRAAVNSPVNEIGISSTLHSKHCADKEPSYLYFNIDNSPRVFSREELKKQLTCAEMKITRSPSVLARKEIQCNAGAAVASRLNRVPFVSFVGHGPESIYMSIMDVKKFSIKENSEMIFE